MDVPTKKMKIKKQMFPHCHLTGRIKRSIMIVLEAMLMLLLPSILLFSAISFSGTTAYSYDDVNHVIHIQSGGGTPAL